jgi:hypothetical protein
LVTDSIVELEVGLVVRLEPGDEEHQHDHDQEQPKRRDLRRSVAVQIPARQPGGPQAEVRQGAPDPAIDIDQPAESLRRELAQRAMEVLR